jgi:lipoprotein signal peptidase
MDEKLIYYFTAEKQESLFFITIGIIAFIVSLYLFKTDSPYKGMMYPLIFIAIIQLTVGGTVFFRTDNQVAALKTQLHDDPQTYKSAELSRMGAVIKNFRVYKGIEIILLILGIVLTCIFREKDLWYFVGIGLIIQSSLMLVLDLFAEKRAHDYLRFVENIF